jgi:hypothetical protein
VDGAILVDFISVSDGIVLAFSRVFGGRVGMAGQYGGSARKIVCYRDNSVAIRRS